MISEGRGAQLYFRVPPFHVGPIRGMSEFDCVRDNVLRPAQLYLDYNEFRDHVLRQMCRAIGVPWSIIVPPAPLRIGYLPTAEGGP